MGRFPEYFDLPWCFDGSGLNEQLLDINEIFLFKGICQKLPCIRCQIRWLHTDSKILFLFRQKLKGQLIGFVQIRLNFLFHAFNGIIFNINPCRIRDDLHTIHGHFRCSSCKFADNNSGPAIFCDNGYRSACLPVFI